MYNHISDVTERTLTRFTDTSKHEDPESGCILWLGRLDRDGYGVIRGWVDGVDRRYAAHRVAYLIEHGAIPDGLVIDHLCRNRACVNPAHHEPVTNAENLRRGRPMHQLECKQGHPLSGANLFLRPGGARGCRECRRQAVSRYQAKRRAAAA